MSWIADNASSNLSTTSQSSTQSTHVTEIPTPPAPAPQPPPPQSAPSQENLPFEPAYSEELFSGPFPHSQTTCPVAAEQFSDAQVFHQSQSVGDDDLLDVVEVCKEVSDDEETRLSDSGEVVVRAGSPRGEQTEGSEDDEVTDPSWVERPGEHSASETEESPRPEQVGRGSGGARRRGRARAVATSAFTSGRAHHCSFPCVS
ncbi:hypothetical protein GDO81_008439 [Engystomops pustulosus]|uniref:Uncharacterized protein n=1 Tax=Engystomops pustulosus TaxID=76066 RepID=A0AAV7CFM9_ENGPU|nr:hypothetical protein GDO81_008439 [Engystomops pustulosus]